MFDDLNQSSQGGKMSPLPPAMTGNKEPGVPVNVAQPSQGSNQPIQPKPVEDIFGDTDRMNKPDILKPKQGESGDKQINEQARQYSGSLPGSRNLAQKLFTFVLIVAILALLGVGGYWGYTYWQKRISTTPQTTDQSVNTTAEKQTNTVEEQSTKPTETDTNAIEPAVTNEVTAPQPKDSDQDGLTDEEEAALGTSPNNPDTDNDGLFDREEVKVYKTDPLNPDTDGDSYKDGDEVKSGYNPKGSGKLYEFNK